MKTHDFSGRGKSLQVGCSFFFFLFSNALAAAIIFFFFKKKFVLVVPSGLGGGRVPGGYRNILLV